MDRRDLLIATAALPWPAFGDDGASIEKLLQAGGVVIAFRHALAPGTYDPPGFRLGECSTQRNLDDQGRAQAARIGRWFKDRSLVPAKVLSSPWCRCLDTARLAFARVDSWAALGSPRAGTETVNATALSEIRQALAAATARPRGFEAWVTHAFVLSALTGENPASGEGLVLRAEPDGTPKVLGHLRA
jgi:Histidine phosphatase superfamily (branch 1)